VTLSPMSADEITRQENLVSEMSDIMQTLEEVYGVYEWELEL
jgi:hypothetical protein